MGETEHSQRHISISVIIITKNEEQMIANCLASVHFADEIIVVDSGSTDNTVEIASREGAKIIETSTGMFKDWRNLGLKEASGDWLLYIDADERVTPKLAREIRQIIQFTSLSSYRLKRNNVHFGKWLEHGGWETDTVVRLFKKASLQKWEGDVHEHAVIEGNSGELKETLVHLTHRKLSDGLLKSVVWTDIEARLLLNSHARRVGPITLVRKTLFEFIRRLLIKKGYKDGTEGWIESMQQAMNRFFVYERLWELQQKPNLEEKYERIEKEIGKMWKGS